MNACLKARNGKGDWIWIETFFFGVCSSLFPPSLLFSLLSCVLIVSSFLSQSFMSGKNLKMHQSRDFIFVWEYIKYTWYLISTLSGYKIQISRAIKSRDTKGCKCNIWGINIQEIQRAMKKSLSFPYPSLPASGSSLGAQVFHSF